MDLRSWRAKERLTLKAVGDGVGCTKTALSDIERDVRRPSTDLAKRIEAFTRGEVTAASLLGLEDSKSKRRAVREDAAIYQPSETIAVKVPVSPQQKQDLIDLGIDIESVARTGAQKALAEAYSKAFADANRDAIEAYNAWIKKHGTLAEQLGLI